MHVLGLMSAWFGMMCAGLFVATYSLTARWWSSVEGRTVVAVGAVFAANAACQVVLIAWPDAQWEWAVRSTMGFIGGALMLRLCALVWRAQIGGGKDRHEARQ